MIKRSLPLLGKSDKYFQTVAEAQMENGRDKFHSSFGFLKDLFEDLRVKNPGSIAILAAITLNIDEEHIETQRCLWCAVALQTNKTTAKYCILRWVLENPELVIITDRGKGLIAAIQSDLPSAHHRWCALRLLNNIPSPTISEDNVGLYWKIVKSSTRAEFDELMNRLKTKHPNGYTIGSAAATKQDTCFEYIWILVFLFGYGGLTEA